MQGQTKSFRLLDFHLPRIVTNYHRDNEIVTHQVEVQRVLGPERRVSRLEREDQLVQKAMRKKSRKVELRMFRINYIDPGVS